MNLKDKIIVITGAAQGLGSAIAHQLGSQGAQLALVDINPETLDSAVQKHLNAGHRVSAFVANIADESSVQICFNEIIKHFGAIHGLVNNAGIVRDGMLVKVKEGKVVKQLSLTSWQQVIDVNLTGVFLCGREAAKHMIESQSQGAIVNISSVSRAGNIGQSNYAAAKAGVAALTTTWAKELSRFNIRSAAIAPGFIETEMTGAIKPEILDKIKRSIPQGRMGQPDEIARTVQFIFENDYINGRIIEVDGGLRL